MRTMAQAAEAVEAVEAAKKWLTFKILLSRNMDIYSMRRSGDYSFMQQEVYGWRIRTTARVLH